LHGVPFVADTLHPIANDGTTSVRLRRDARAFFQGNRYLLERFTSHVVALVPSGPVVDLYAGVGLFGLSVAATGAADITLVEGDPVSARDLQENARPFGDRVSVERASVEDFVRLGRARTDATLIVDPPRTGISREALDGIIRGAPGRIVYVSCDVATLARDIRALADRGYALDALRGFDLFPNTAHVETVAVLQRQA
jgi:23S rRNA (uracil1939-C5)-methyltransferase